MLNPFVGQGVEGTGGWDRGGGGEWREATCDGDGQGRGREIKGTEVRRKRMRDEGYVLLERCVGEERGKAR